MILVKVLLWLILLVGCWPLALLIALVWIPVALVQAAQKPRPVTPWDEPALTATWSPKR